MLLIMHNMCLIRVVHENHSTSTKKNREWQEKLPLVVLKSEEIMYSKANSEVKSIHLFLLSIIINHLFIV